MATIKSRKITKIVREFVKQDASYDITGVDLGLAKYLWRVSQDTFQDLAAGDYRIDQSNGKQTLVILNAELLAQAEAFQVGYVLDFTASEYDTEWNVDINQLKEKYNTLVQNTQSLWEYVRLTGFIADDTTINLILPQLDDNQFWFYQDGKYKAYDVSDFRQLGESLIEAYAEYQKSVIELMVRNARENIQNNVDNGAASIQNLLNSLNLSVENFTGDKKLELQKIINDFRKELEVVSVGNANTVQGYVPTNFDRVENTIKDLQNSKKYKIGDVIEVLGYYTAGDGAGHKRKIEATDDGSGVRLANGLWANVVHNGEVNVSWFGAKGDGVTDDGESIKQTHIYSLNNSIDIKYMNKTYLIDCGNDLEIPICSSVNFSSATIIFKIRNKPFKPVFKAQPSKYTDFEFSSTIKKGLTNHIAFKDMELKFLKISGKVNSINSNIINLEEVLFTTSGGCFIGRPFVDRLISSDIDIKYREMSSSLVLKNLNIQEEYDGDKLDIAERFTYKLFEIVDRDNIIIENINNRNNGFVASRITFDFTHCYNITIKNINNEANIKLGTQQGVNTAWGYMFNIDRCINVNLYNVNAPHSNEFSWTGIGAANTKLVNYDNCRIFSPDQHYLIQDMKITNSTITRSVLSGDGYRIYDNVTFSFSSPLLTSVFTFRGASVTGHFNSYEGDVIVRDCIVKIPSYNSEKIYDLIKFDNVSDLNSSISDKYFDNFVFDNLKIEVVGGNDIRPIFNIFRFVLTNKRYFKTFTMRNCDFSKTTMLESGRTFYNGILKHHSLPVRNSEGYPIESSMVVNFNNIIFPDDYMESSEKRRGFTYLQYNDSESFLNELVEVNYNNCKNVSSVTGSCGIVNITNSHISNLYIGGGTQYTRKAKVCLDNSYFDKWISLNVPSDVAIDSKTLYMNKNTLIDVATGKFLPSQDLSPYYTRLKSSQIIFNDNYGEKIGFIKDPTSQLNTPYHALKMQQEGVYEDFITYMDEKTEYDNQQREAENQPEGVMLLPVMEEPQPSEKLLAFKEKYLG